MPPDKHASLAETAYAKCDGNSALKAGPEIGLGQLIPVFLISFDRGAMLEKVIASIRALSTPTEIVVHDNGSTEPYTLAALQRLSHQGVTVFREKAIVHADELNCVNLSIDRYFANRTPCRYIVTDCDIDMGVADKEALFMYGYFLDRFPNAECVGPMLRIRDIPGSYPLFNHVMNRHIEQFWHQRPSWVETSMGNIAYIAAPIDTTFALHRAGSPFRRLKRGIRVYEPFEALHLDWYGGADVDRYTITSDPQISHWNNLQERILQENAVLKHTHFIAVRRNCTGFVEYEEMVHSHTSDTTDI